MLREIELLLVFDYRSQASFEGVGRCLMCKSTFGDSVVELDDYLFNKYKFLIRLGNATFSSL